MTVQFNIDSRHNEDARFKKVLFGQDGKLLEVELNELQDIVNARRSLLVDKVFGSRPLYTGTYAIATNTLTVTNESVAIGKELIFIPSASIAVANGDTIYLNFQEKSVTKDDTIKQYGLITGAGVVTNFLLDSRLGEETTRRVQVAYQLTKTNVGTGTFLKLCTITGGAVVKSTADYPDSDLYKEVRRLASEVITSDGVWTSLANHKASTTDHAAATQSANGFMSSGDKTKLDGIASGAEVNQNTYSSVTAGGVTVTSASKTGTLAFSAGNAVTLSGDNTAKSVTITVANATQAAAGAMSAADKTKLDGIATSAEVNQFAFSNIAVSGQTTIAADSKVDTLTLAAGNAVTITTDATNDVVTITVANATSTVAGAMSAADKTKLDSITPGAGVNQNSFSFVTAGGVTIQADNATDTLDIAAGNAVTISGDAVNDRVTIAVANATTTAAGAMSAADKTKLDGIATGAEVNQNAFSTVNVGGTNLAADTKTGTLNITAGNAVTLTPTAATDTFTIAVANATTTAAGAMSSADKTKLDGIATGAEVNQNAFTTVKVGTTNVDADAKSDVLELAAGSGITLTPDAVNDKVTFAVAMDDTVHGNRGGGALHSAVTTSTNGFMLSTDKSKLDGIASSAEVNQNAFSSVTAGGVTVSSASKTGTLAFTAGNAVTLSGDNTGKAVTITVANATQSAAGAMSSADKTKLDGIASGAEVNQNAFTTVVVAGQTNVVADVESDTLTLVAGTGVTLTTDATADSVTITAKTGSTSQAGIVQLTDGVTSTSTTTAATAASAKKAYDDSVAYAKSSGLGLGTNALANNTDLNTVLQSGFYRLDGTHPNAPSGAGYAYGQLVVSAGSATADTVTQLLFPYSTGDMYVRSGNVNGNVSGTWSSWKRVAYQTDLDNLGFGVSIPNYNGVDLNGFNSNGQYYISNGINIPPLAGNNGYLISTVLNAGLYQMQQYIVHTNGEKYLRVRVNGGWGAWIPLTSNPFVYLKGGQWNGVNSSSTEIILPVNLSNVSPIEWYYNNGFTNGAYGELICGVAGKYDIYAQGFISGLNQYQEFMMRIRQVAAVDGRISNVTHGVYGFSGLGSNYNAPSGVPCHVNAVFDLKVGDKLSFACICSESPRNLNSFSLKAVRIGS